MSNNRSPLRYASIALLAAMGPLLQSAGGNAALRAIFSGARLGLDGGGPKMWRLTNGNGDREIARRRRQIEKGQLTKSNGLTGWTT